MQEFKIRDEFIRLGQLLKAAGLVDSGVAAKDVINNGEVLVNGETETRRGKKLVAGDIVKYEDNMIRICE